MQKIPFGCTPAYVYDLICFSIGLINSPSGQICMKKVNMQSDDRPCTKSYDSPYTDRITNKRVVIVQVIQAVFQGLILCVVLSTFIYMSSIHIPHVYRARWMRLFVIKSISKIMLSMSRNKRNCANLSLSQCFHRMVSHTCLNSS